MKNIYPSAYYKDIYSINYKSLRKNGIKYLLFDLDNTLVHPHKMEFNKKLEDLIIELKIDFKIYIVSNSPKRRVSFFAKHLSLEYVAFALKPWSFRIKKLLSSDYSKYVIIGDQLLTDIKVGNKLGIKTILVDPLYNNDILVTKFNRYQEQRISNNQNNKFEKGKYYE